MKCTWTNHNSGPLQFLGVKQTSQLNHQSCKPLPWPLLFHPHLLGLQRVNERNSILMVLLYLFRISGDHPSRNTNSLKSINSRFRVVYLVHPPPLLLMVMLFAATKQQRRAESRGEGKRGYEKACDCIPWGRKLGWGWDLYRDIRGYGELSSLFCSLHMNPFKFVFWQLHALRKVRDTE